MCLACICCLIGLIGARRDELPARSILELSSSPCGVVFHPSMHALIKVYPFHFHFNECNHDKLFKTHLRKNLISTACKCRPDMWHIPNQTLTSSC